MAAKTKRSNIWFHFTEGTNECRAKCNHCSLYLSTKSGSLGNLNRQMRNKHPTISRQSTVTPSSNINNLASTSLVIQDSTPNILLCISRPAQLNPITNYIRKSIKSIIKLLEWWLKVTTLCEWWRNLN